MSCRGKTRMDEDMMLKIEEFHVFSWKLEEYKEAVENQIFFNNVKDRLDSSSQSDDCTALDLIHSKFYFAGGSSRFMFQLSTSKVVEFLNESVEAVYDVAPYLQGWIGDVSNQIFNRLFTIYPRHGRGKEKSIVSRYAAFQLALKVGPELVLKLSGVIRHINNPSMTGWLYEMFFFSRLRKGGVTLYNVGGNETEWQESLIQVVDIKRGKFPTFPKEKGIWLKPLHWDQGGYDAVLVDKNNALVRFVQVTNGDTHSFKIEFFSAFLGLLRDSNQSFEIKTLEIVFVVELGKLEDFRISDPTGQGLLAAFTGWEKGKEKEMSTLLGLKV
jgi:hypothetical protein